MLVCKRKVRRGDIIRDNDVYKCNLNIDEQCSRQVVASAWRKKNFEECEDARS
jgi:hypothetical protein